MASCRQPDRCEYCIAGDEPVQSLAKAEALETGNVRDMVFLFLTVCKPSSFFLDYPLEDLPGHVASLHLNSVDKRTASMLPFTAPIE
jgi:hypothetical protein